MVKGTNKDYYLEICDDDLVLPSEIENKNRLKRKKRQKAKSKIKWSLIILIIVLIYLFYNTFISYFMNLLKSNPLSYSYFLYIQNQIGQKTLIGLLFISTLGSIFFLMLPSEAIFIYYLTSTNFPVPILIFIISFGSILGMIINYLLGFLLNERVLKLFFKEEKFNMYKEKVDEYGGYFLFFGNILPGPIEVVALFYGAFKFGFVKYLYLTFVGRVIKYILIFIAFYFFWDKIIAFYSNLVVIFPFLKNIL